VATGAAFGLRVGERSGAIEGRHAYYVVESLARREADSAAWVAQRDAQRQSIVDAARQARVRVYLDDLRARATVVDRRQELARAAAEAPATF
jgi:parvulin-like peptidyl-prolyl isomerase